MNLQPKILIVRESRHDEKRVSLIPRDAYKLIKDGYNIFVEDQAGVGAGFDNQAYEEVGANVCKRQYDNIASYRAFFHHIDIIVRVKRPDPLREEMECLAIRPGTKMVGSLDLLERNSKHLQAYQAASIDYYSFEAFCYPPNSPMDAIKKMSAFAGKLALDDAMSKMHRAPQKVVIIGYGEAGKAALEASLRKKITSTVITTQSQKVTCITSKGGTALHLGREIPLLIRQEKIMDMIKDADIVITAASSNGEVAPIFIPQQSLLAMKPGAIVVDLSVPDGGNVAGSKPDAIVTLGNNVQVMNVSGYPKAVPHEASIEWSKASYYFLDMLIKNPKLLIKRENFASKIG